MNKIKNTRGKYLVSERATADNTGYMDCMIEGLIKKMK